MTGKKIIPADRERCADCQHYGIVRTLNHPQGRRGCVFAIIPCDSCRDAADRFNKDGKRPVRPGHDG